MLCTTLVLSRQSMQLVRNTPCWTDTTAPLPSTMKYLNDWYTILLTHVCECVISSAAKTLPSQSNTVVSSICYIIHMKCIPYTAYIHKPTLHRKLYHFHFAHTQQMAQNLIPRQKQLRSWYTDCMYGWAHKLSSKWERSTVSNSWLSCTYMSNDIWQATIGDELQCLQWSSCESGLVVDYIYTKDPCAMSTHYL